MKTLCSLDGGGIRAYVLLQILKYIEAATGKRCVELFDVLAGCSTGSICAIALAQGKSAVEVEAFYDQWASKIFSRRWLNRLSFGLTGAMYSAATLESALKSVLGDKTLIPPKAFVCATQMKPLAPVDIHAGTAPNWFAWEAARASSAAPTYFDPFTLEGTAFWDGGCVGGNNNPALTALEVLGIDESQALVLSLGTGVGIEGWDAQAVQHWSKLELLPALLEALMDASSEQVHQDLQHAIPAGQYLRLQATLANTAMDDASSSNIAALKAAGAALVAKNRTALDAFIHRLPGA